VQRSDLAAAISALPHLTDLILTLPSDASVDVDGPPLALRLPALRRLTLLQLRLPPLSFLQHSPLLERLTLTACLELSATDLMRCLPAYTPRLQSLRLDRNWNMFLDAQQGAQLEPPSALLPALTEFEYQDDE
jgi:hypothetical protein